MTKETMFSFEGKKMSYPEFVRITGEMEKELREDLEEELERLSAAQALKRSDKSDLENDYAQRLIDYSEREIKDIERKLSHLKTL